MERMEPEPNDLNMSNLSDGFTLPSGPPLTPQLSIISPASLTQGGQFTITQLQALANSQNVAASTPNTAATSGTAGPGLNTFQTLPQTGTLQFPTDSAINPPANQQVQPPTQFLQSNSLVHPQNQNQQWTFTQPMVNTEPALNQGPQIVNPFAQLTNQVQNFPTPVLLPNNPQINSENQILTVASSGQQGPHPLTSSSQMASTGNQLIIDNNNLAAYISALANQNQTSGPIQLGNLVTLNNGMLLSTANPQLAPNQIQNAQVLSMSNGTAAGQAVTTQQPVPGTRAYQLLAVNQTRKHHTIKKDIERMKHLKAMKIKLVGKTFQPLNYRYASNYKTLEALPGWWSNSNKEKLRQWGLRGAERFRQTLLLEIEAEMLKVKGRRDVLFHDEQNGTNVFTLVAQARNDLRI